jgi:hypothetical protein
MTQSTGLRIQDKLHNVSNKQSSSYHWCRYYLFITCPKLFSPLHLPLYPFTSSLPTSPPLLYLYCLSISHLWVGTGIGAGAAKLFAKEGAKVVLCARSKDKYGIQNFTIFKFN